jgi:O-acetylserine/cysteine efflux transporter
MNNSRRLVFAALISAGVLWGTTVPLSKVALAWLPPAGLAFVRFALAAALLMFFRRSRLRAAASPAILISGALGYGGSVVLQNFGIERTSVTHAALLIGATPVVVAVLAAVCGHGVARPAAWLGFSLSLAGVGVIAAGRGGGASIGGDGLVLAGQFASAAFTVAQARLLRGRDPVAVTGLQLMAAAVVTAPVVLLTGGLHAGPVSAGPVLATVALVLAGTVGPTTLFTFAQTAVPADVAGAFLNLEPLVGAIAGTVLFANPVGLVQVAGGAAILAGIGLSSLDAVRGSRSEPAATEPAVIAAPERAVAEPALAGASAATRAAAALYVGTAGADPSTVAVPAAPRLAVTVSAVPPDRMVGVDLAGLGGPAAAAAATAWLAGPPVRVRGTAPAIRFSGPGHQRRQTGRVRSAGRTAPRAGHRDGPAGCDTPASLAQEAPPCTAAGRPRGRDRAPAAPGSRTRTPGHPAFRLAGSQANRRAERV